MEEQVKRFIDEHGFITFVTATFEKIRLHINDLFSGYLQDIETTASDAKTYIETTASDYAGAVYLSQEEYNALTDEQKNDPTKVYFIEA